MQDASMTSELTTNGASSDPVEHRLLDALQSSRSRRERNLRRQEQRKSRWLASFSRFGLDRHHLSETRPQALIGRAVLTALAVGAPGAD